MAAGFGGITWLGDWFEGFAPDAQKEIKQMKTLFDHVHDGYSDYFDKSKTNDINITQPEYKDWSVRKISHSGKIAKSIYSKFKDKNNPNNIITLHDKGIYVENYEVSGKSYKVAIYSAKSTVDLKNDKIRLKGYRDLANHTYVKAGYTSKYGIIALYDESKNMRMLLQISGADTDSPEKTAAQWLNYLAIVVASNEQKEYDKITWDKIKDKIVKLLSTDELPQAWGDKQSEKQDNSKLKIEYEQESYKSVITEDIEKMLYRVFSNAKINRTMIITSTLRSPEEQARIMINNIKSRGVQAQKRLYDSKGDKVIDYYVSISHLDKEEIIRLMVIKMQELDFGSAHCNWKKRGAIDFGAESNEFNTIYASDVPLIIEELRKEPMVNPNQIFPPSEDEPALHIEIKLTN